MGAMQRTKGKAGEREVAAIIRDLTGWDVQRRVRQHDGDSDLLGVPGWSVEVKRYATADRGDIRKWWAQTVEQSKPDMLLPVLFFRRNRDDWRAVFPVSVGLVSQHAGMWEEYAYTVESSLEAWAAVARDVAVEAAQ